MSEILHPTELGTILSIWAHPDDETFLAGGIMAAAAANGQRVVCISATAGEHGTDDAGAWPPARLARIRGWETAAAMAVLGVAEHRFLGYEDGRLAALEPAEPQHRIGELIEEVRPDTVLTFGPDGNTFHPDHRAVGEWAADAWRLTGRRGRLLRSAWSRAQFERWLPRYEEWGIFMTDERPVGLEEDELAVRFELPDELLDRKVTALAAMWSQTAPAIDLMGYDDFRADSAIERFVAAT